jgi:UDP-N-acetylmuramoyl-L-alanyl-D-glutamate--2,6-diaminopimelate ligase
MSMTLAEWARQLGWRFPHAFVSGRKIEGVSANTAHISEGDLFVCMPSTRRDTHEFLAEAKSKGAGAALVHSAEGLLIASQLGLDAIQLTPEPKRAFLGEVAALAHGVLGEPCRRLVTYGVTGTNGKTSTAIFLQQALTSAGQATAYLGTLGYGPPTGEREILANTTPFPVELAQLLARAVDDGAQAIAMEASSHALEENRLAHCAFDVAVFTNLSQDHLDFHGSMEAYAGAKKRLFTEWAAIAREKGKDPRFALNADDPVASRWLEDVPKALTYGRNGGDLRITPVRVALDRIRFRADYQGVQAELDLGVGGNFNVDNAAAALAGLVAGGMNLEEAAKAIANIQPVRGRFEPVPNDRGIFVIVDYAHTPDAVEKLLMSAREVCPGRVITVFGCGGDRDRTKRPLMAQAAARQSDELVVTSDNPRTEDPEKILDDVVAGLSGVTYDRIADRPAAITHAVHRAQPGDLVVIAGKGHEDYQIIGHTKYPMDDVELARRALETNP